MGRCPRSEAQLSPILDVGVTLIINLTTPSEDLGYEVPSAYGNVEVIHFPIPDRRIRNDRQTLEFVKEYGSKVRDNVTYVHCKGGLGRTGVIAGLFLSVLTGDRDYGRVCASLSDGLERRKYKLHAIEKMAVRYKSPQTEQQRSQLKRLLPDV